MAAPSPLLFKLIKVFQAIRDYDKSLDEDDEIAILNKRRSMRDHMKNLGAVDDLLVNRIDNTGYLQRFIIFWQRGIYNTPGRKEVNKFLQRARALDREQVDVLFDNMSTELQVYNSILVFCNETPQSSISACRKILKRYFINIFDYKDNQPQYIYRSKTALMKRCRERGFYPLKKAKNELLKGLLHHLIN